MATTDINGAGVGTPLNKLLLADSIEPGAEVSYELCKIIYTHHPLGKKLADTPIILAQSQQREIAVPGAPERVKDQFVAQWKKDGCDGHISNVGSLSRVYGVAAIGLMIKDAKPTDPIDFEKLAEQEITFNVWDALNLAGSQVLNLDPNSFDFLKPVDVTVAGTPYHPSRAIVKMHENPIYLSYTTAAYGFTGRSVYQRALFPLKSFIDTMVTDAMVARKAGLIVAKMKPPGSIVDRLQQAMYGIKRVMIQWGRTDNVLGITPEESIETLDMQNVNNAMEVSRKNILDNIATAADMPAVILNQETFAEGFGEGVEDAKSVARYIGAVRDDLDPIYTWFNEIVMRRAWSQEFYKTIQRDDPDQYGDVPYNQAFYEWKNAFSAIWPSLIEEPESEKVKADDVKLKSVIATVQVVEPMLPDQHNKAVLLGWMQDNLNENKAMFRTPLDLDLDAIEEYEPPPPAEGAKGPGEPQPFAAADADTRVRWAA
jgi:hypothetical protein